MVQLLCFCFWDRSWSPAKPLRNTSINTVVLTIVSYSIKHFSCSKGSNKAHSIDFERLLQSKHPCLLCLLSVVNWKLTNYDATKSSSDSFPNFPQTVPFVKWRKIAVFKVEYLGSFLTKSYKSLDYDHLDQYFFILTNNLHCIFNYF